MKASYRVVILTLALMGGALATYLSVQALDNDELYEDSDFELENEDYDYDDESDLDSDDDLESQNFSNDFLDNDDL